MNRMDLVGHPRPWYAKFSEAERIRRYAYSLTFEMEVPFTHVSDLLENENHKV